ncbi:MAG TPA: hypothetical protein VKB59_05540 [Micromonosporaceae bacterium]|nr:hypothetical protein [Micromonosporaceae bacterium]
MRCLRWFTSFLVVMTTLSLGACTAERTAVAPSEVRISWRAVGLPSDPRGRDVVRATAACGDHWYAAGAILAPDGGTSPALWVSTDFTSFTSVPVQAVSVYGPSNVLYGLACRGADVAAVGAKNGGAHGNPRTSTWLRRDDGPLREVPAGFELFGGPNAGFVGQLSAGPGGYLIVGARIDAHGGPGAAVWQSADGSTFTLVDSDPALESDARGATEVHGGVVTSHGYVSVGGITPVGSRFAARDPVAWRSSDARTWQRVPLPHSAADDVMLQVVPVGDSLLAVGSDGGRFRVWTADASGARWQTGPTFGGAGDSATVPTVSSLAVIGSTVYAVVANSATYEMWRGGTTGPWERVTLPIAVPSAPVTSGPRVVSATASGGAMMLATDDGRHAAVWFGHAA